MDNKANNNLVDLASEWNVLLIGLIFIIGITVGIILLYVFFKKWRRGRIFDLAVLKVALPFEDEEVEQGKTSLLENIREKIAVMEQFYSTLTEDAGGTVEKALGLPQFSLEIAVNFSREDIAFYLVVPKKKIDLVKKQVHSFFPQVTVEESENYNIFPPTGETVGCYMKLAKEDHLSIKTYKELESDPLNSITNALSKLDGKKEGAAVQFVLCPINSKSNTSLQVAKAMKQGKTYEQARAEVDHPVLNFLGDIFKSQGKIEKDKEKHILTPQEEKFIEMIENKASKNRFKVNIRIIAAAEKKEQANTIVTHFKNSFSQFKNGSGNEFKSVNPHSIKDFVYDFTFRVFRKTHSFILSSEELASLFHLNINILKAAPKIVSESAKTAPAPSNLPQEGLLLGKNIFRGQETEVKISQEDRRRHYYIIGQTGTGKSALMSEMIRQDIEGGKGLCVIDPHGDLVEKVLTYIPQNRIKDTIYFDPADVQKPMGLNLLEYDKPEQKTFVINEMINIFDKLYDLKQTGGPMFEQYMRNAMLLVMSDPASGSTLLEISRVLSDQDFRKYKLDKCSDQVIVNFWVKEAEKAGGEAALANMVPYITSKLTSFVSNDLMRPIIAQQKSAFNLREVMDGEKIILMNLSKGKIGELNSYLLGMVMVGKILMSAMGRVDMPEEKRKDFYLYIDEFQNFTTDSINSILSEARKYRLNLVIANQFLKQLSEETRDAVFGNVGSLASFRVGPEDAEYVEKQLEPVFTAHDLMNIDNFNAYTKLMINGKVSTPFSFATTIPKEGDGSVLKDIKEYSSNTYGSDRKEVEAEIAERLAHGGENIASSKPVDSDMGIK